MFWWQTQTVLIRLNLVCETRNLIFFQITTVNHAEIPVDNDKIITWRNRKYRIAWELEAWHTWKDWVVHPCDACEINYTCSRSGSMDSNSKLQQLVWTSAENTSIVSICVNTCFLFVYLYCWWAYLLYITFCSAYIKLKRSKRLH